jgi:hypothetical protein
MLLFPLETFVVHSSFLLETEALNNFTQCRSFPPLRYHLPFLLCPIKCARSLKIHCRIYFPPSFEFPFHKNTLSSELKSSSLPLIAIRPHPSPRATTGEVPREPLFLLKHPWWAPMYHNHRALELRWVLVITGPPLIKCPVYGFCTRSTSFSAWK